jgi:flagellar biosynthesis protein FlhA
MILEPSMVTQVLSATKPAVEKLADLGRTPICLCSARVRPHFKRLTEHSFPMLAVLSYNEVDANISIDSVGLVKLNDAN